MSVERIQDLAAASTPLTGAELVEIEQGGASAQCTAQDIADLGSGGGSSRNVVTAVTPVAGVATLDYSLGDYFTITLAANITSWVISNPPGAGRGFSLMVQITQGSGPYTVADPGTAPGGSITVSTGNGDIDVLAITSFDNGATLRCNLANDYT